jgi:predicted  nucleic acid-binding Zn-ribbon protein
MDNIQEVNTATPKGGNKGYLIAIVLLSIYAISITILYITQERKTEVKIVQLTQVTAEKDSLTVQYQNLLDNYETLQTDNDTISAQLNREKEHIKMLMTQLRNTKANNKAEITKLKNELQTLRDIMKGFIHQIDSLNTLNIQLTEENQQVKKQIVKAQKENKQLNEKYEEAATKVAKASVIKAVNISMQSYNERGKETIRSKKIRRFAVNFALDENVIAPQGTKNLYIRITSPNDLMLMNPQQDTFRFEGEQITYSALRQIEYNGKVTPATIYYECPEGSLTGGTYKADIFCDGNMIGTTSITIK